jgi:hypothetical protein
VYFNTRGHLDTCIKIHVAKCAFSVTRIYHVFARGQQFATCTITVNVAKCKWQKTIFFCSERRGRREECFPPPMVFGLKGWSEKRVGRVERFRPRVDLMVHYDYTESNDLTKHVEGSY